MMTDNIPPPAEPRPLPSLPLQHEYPAAYRAFKADIAGKDYSDLEIVSCWAWFLSGYIQCLRLYMETGIL